MDLSKSYKTVFYEAKISYNNILAKIVCLTPILFCISEIVHYDTTSPLPDGLGWLFFWVNMILLFS